MLVAFVTITPDLVQKLGPAEHQARVTCEVQQQVKFTCRQVDQLPANRDFPAGRIDCYRAYFDRFTRSRDCFLNGFDAAENGFDPRDQFGHAEWLGDIVIGAQFQPENTIEFR